MNKIHILKGKIQTGKSTRLVKWTRTCDSCAGIITPFLNGKKYIVDIAGAEKRALQTYNDNGEQSVEKIGNYIFLRESLIWARKKLIEAVKIHPQWLVIDEIGYLELNNRGFEPAFSQILPEIKNNLLLVIREKLIERVCEKYNFKKYAEVTISEKLPYEK